MKINTVSKTLIIGMLFFSNELLAQSEGTGMSFLVYILLAIAVLLVLGLIIQVSDNMLAIEARQLGAEQEGVNYGIFPRLSEIFATPRPDYVNGSGHYSNLTKGFDILLEGEAKMAKEEALVTRFAIQPTDFIGLSPIPKVIPEIGAEIKAGDPLFYDKKRPEIIYVSPVSGELIELNRGEKRAITELVILADKEMKYKEFEAFDLEKNTREALVNYLLTSGVWPMIRQRPFNVVADPALMPRDIFISTFDTAPLAPDYNYVIKGQEDAFQKGLDVLNKLTEGSVFLGLDANGSEAPSGTFANAKNVTKHWVKGQHPAGNVGVQIHNVKPISAGEIVWTLGVQEVISLGKLFTEQRFASERTVVLSGAELEEPKYVNTYIGANVGELVKGNVQHDKVRYISGDVLSGKQKAADQYLSFYSDQLTVIEEGDYFEMFGWLIPIKGRPSVSRTFPNFLFPDLTFKADSNMHGEERAFVVTGQYEQVLPMDIYPQHLMKAILINDFERMEGLGIYELVEEDLALCEFVCTSKQPLQSILREGLDVMREQS